MKVLKYLKLCALCVAAIFLSTTTLSAQRNPVRWKITAKETSPKEFDLKFDIRIENGWHIYDLGPYDDYGPSPTEIVFESVEGAEILGIPRSENASVKEYDEIFKTEVGYFEGSVSISQKVRITDDRAVLAGEVKWRLCKDKTCYATEAMDFRIELESGGKTVVKTGNNAAIANNAALTADTPETQQASGKSMWGMIVNAILWALAALVTPCVFPMIPMTVSLFMKGAENKKRGRFRAGMYGIFIVLLFTLPIALLIVITRIFGGEAVTTDIFNWLATHWLPNIIFFLVFIVFAVSFFGAFEIRLPSKWLNNSDKNADKKGLGGIFFMALTLVLVSFSCTGPIISTVIIDSLSGEFWAPILTMFVFSVTFAIPFVLFALFPGWLTKLPKSGGWLNSVKVVLGFIELAFGLKFLSVADQTYHWGILDREIYLALWIVIFTMLGFYLLGKMKFKHDSDVKFISVPRLALAIIVFAFVVYMVPGMWGAPLKGLSGYLPPLTTQDFVLGQNTNTVYVRQAGSSSDGLPSDRKYADKLRLPHGLEGFFDYDEGLDYARRVNKPVFVDITGHGCVNCREMEARVWSDSEVQRILREKYVIVALYIDDKTEALPADWVTTATGRTLKGIGQVNAYYAANKFGTNAQPNYIIMGTDDQMLLPPRGYDLDVQGFIDFLNTGVDEYTKTR